jgi:transposase
MLYTMEASSKYTEKTTSGGPASGPTKASKEGVKKPAPSSTTAPEAAPDKLNVAEVVALLAQLLADGHQAEVLKQVEALLLAMANRNDDLSAQLAVLRKQMFGQRTEKMSAQQLQLFLDAAAQQGLVEPSQTSPSDQAAEPEAPLAPDSKEPQRRPGRNPLPKELPRKRIDLLVAPENRICPECGLEKTCAGHEQSEVLNFVPGHFEVLQYWQERLACRPCMSGMCTAAPALKLQKGSMCGPGLLSQVLVGKYLDHCPLYRQRVIFARSGVDLAESTLGSWVELGYTLLLPIAKQIWKAVNACSVVGGDDTGLRVLDSDAPGGSKRGHIWAFVGYGEDGRPRYAAMRYTADWKKEGPARFLQGFSGTLQGDGYAGWVHAAAVHIAIRLAGCMAHGRRKLKEALDQKALGAAAALHIIQKLYQIEAAARENQLDPEARHLLRQEKSVPLMAELKAWVDKYHGKARPSSLLGEAVGYLHNQWSLLEVFLSDGRVPIDNNIVENQIRPICLGKKNYMFAGSDEGAKRAAVMYTVLATCKIVGVEPWAYLNDVLPQLSQLVKKNETEEYQDTDADVSHLVPHVWLARREAEMAAGAALAAVAAA